MRLSILQLQKSPAVRRSRKTAGDLLPGRIQSEKTALTQRAYPLSILSAVPLRARPRFLPRSYLAVGGTSVTCCRLAHRSLSSVVLCVHKGSVAEILGASSAIVLFLLGHLLPLSSYSIVFLSQRFHQINTCQPANRPVNAARFVLSTSQLLRAQSWRTLL